MGNDTSSEVFGIHTCKLLMRKGRTLYLHDVFFEPKVCQNLVFIVVLVKLGFKIAFEQDYVKVLLNNIVLGMAFYQTGLLY